ncbi:hypothetical protein TBLA_0B04680 [Henningerozyma blattae CBS 6284]|uniref:Raptor N-terminal CASPase-like domain-containing protein n=1 Tax=Henningerozyma blattae (strain ATCC 34711 / CBS 6284 / DSM 70876 / NBRC 10599 / NRRL Y-10934 / UCD 77-7) TaxID=1071380 RepID=I2GYV2_HENB6|nr:hypothetical protein TBLA_0B04680 [Tetrapisispora blattae CBS 6284]CCH59304.1 hypothetical protein TBLA_0B04680 [Tetrapisispora blattae CBS 6284]
MTLEYGPQPLKPLNTETRHGFEEQYNSEQFLQSLANEFQFYFDDKRHKTNGNPIPDEVKLKDEDLYYQPIPDWKIVKDRQKTVSAALLLCLNLGVDPPDVIKPHPCARIEAGVDPLNFQDSKKAIEQIGKMLQNQYETLSLRTRYKQSLDPCVEDVKRFCTSLRRTSKDDRILFHYNGHGVPQPTPSGEIWVFNRGYTQYIPISLYDLQTWIGAPSIFVWDCSSAGNILNNFKKFVQKRIKDEDDGNYDNASPSPAIAFKECFQLASCREGELLLMSPELPADLFTCCLTCPIDISVKVFLLQSPLKDTKYKILFENMNSRHESSKNSAPEGSFRSSIPNVKIPGVLSDRRSPLGELNWIFTAITDTIAWCSLPRNIFKKLFRHDLMVAALFRNFLLAKRIMPWYNCRPISDPELPDIIANHPLWTAWDVAIDEVLSKLVEDLKKENMNENLENTIALQQQDSIQGFSSKGINHSQTPQQQTDIKGGNIHSQSRFAVGNLSTMSLANYSSAMPRKSQSSPLITQPTPQQQYTGFFEQNLTAFELWLKYSSNSRKPPEQLPIVLQVLLSQVHRIRALVLLSRFLDLGPWAVYLSLSIGIFPYVLKLLQSPAPELKPILVFIWARIMSIDYANIQSELLKEKGYAYFISILVPEWGLGGSNNLGRNNGSSLSLNSGTMINTPRNKYASPIAANSSSPHIPGLYHSNDTTDEQKAMAVFILSAFIRDFPSGQKQCFNLDLVNRLRYYIENSEVPLLRQWSVILLGQLCYQHPLFKYISLDLGVFNTLHHSLDDPVPEVRTAALFAIQCSIIGFDEPEIVVQLKQEFDQQYYHFHNQLQQLQNAQGQQSPQMEQQQNKLEQRLNSIHFLNSQLENIDFGRLRKQEMSHVVKVLSLVNDASPLVRKQLLVYFSHILHRYYNLFQVVAFDSLIGELAQLEGNDIARQNIEHNSASHGSVFSAVWKSILILASDGMEEIRKLAYTLIDNVLSRLGTHPELKAPFAKMVNYLIQRRSAKSSMTGKPVFNMGQVHVVSGSDQKNKNPRVSDNPVEGLEDKSNGYYSSLNRLFQSLGISETSYESKREDYHFGASEAPGEIPSSRNSPFPTINQNNRMLNNKIPFKSTFLDYCFEYFQEPQMRRSEAEEPGSVEYTARVWRRNRNEEIIQETQHEKLLAISGDWSEQRCTLDNKTQPKLIKFSQFENYLITADERDNITVFDWESSQICSKFSNGNPYGTKITSLQLINEDDNALLLTGSSNGIVKVFKNMHDSEDVEVINSWRALTDMLLTPRSSGLLLEWQQMKGYLLATGDVKVIRIWDAHTESMEVDIPAKTSSLITSITSDQLSGNIFVCGFTDGSLRVYDRRVDVRDAMVRVWRGNGGRQGSSITNVHLQRGGYRELVSGSSNGVVELWDIRSEAPVTTFRDEYNQNLLSDAPVKKQVPTTLTCLQVHEHAPVIATGTKQVKIWTTSGDILSSFKNIPKSGYYNGTNTFSTNGIRSGLSGLSSTYGASGNSNSSFLSSLAFHPHRMMIAATSSHNSCINIFACGNKKYYDYDF